MPRVAFEVHTVLPPESVLAMLTDFSVRRPKLWPTLSPELYEVYEVGTTVADVKEGSLKPTVMWERNHYDWSVPGRVRWTARASNYCKPGSFTETVVRSAVDGGSDLHVEWNRTGVGLKGNILIAVVVLTRGAIIRRKVFEHAFDRAVQNAARSEFVANAAMTKRRDEALDAARYHFSNWLVHNWSRAGLVLAASLFILTPLVFKSSGLAVSLIYLWLPFYMLHQYEEHARGNFLAWYKCRMPALAPFLTERKLLVVNLGSIWVLFTIALYAAFFVRPGLGLAAPYIALVNSAMHVGQLFRWRSYNPGLWTALILFIPAGVCTVITVSATAATYLDNFIGLGIALLVHLFFFAVGRGWILKTV